MPWTKHPPISWGDWHTLLRTKWVKWSRANFPDTDPMTAGEMEKLLFKIEREEAPEVEIVIERFAESGRWPPGSREHSYFLARRIEYAMEILTAMTLTSFETDPTNPSGPYLQRYPVPHPTAPPERIVRWLLKDAWDMLGRSRWINSFILARSR
jgi:hypothetical protein